MAINGVQGTQGQPQRIEKKYDEKTGELRSISIFKDVNGDGKEDLYKITKYTTLSNGKKYVDTYVDRDGDGYNDYHKATTFVDSKKVSEMEIEEEDINDVKKRFHLEHEIYNRRMDVLDGGLLMMKGMPQ